jgi:hypothetical protein
MSDIEGRKQQDFLQRKKKMQLKVLALLVSFSIASGTALAQASASTRSPTIQDLEKKVQALEGQLNAVRNRVAYRLASLDCNLGKYDEFLFETGSLTFFAACNKIEPYLEGHRVTIAIGNPYAFSFKNIKGKLGYGKDFGDALVQNAEVNTHESLRPGSWNTSLLL